MPHDSDQVHVTPLTHLEFIHASAVRADFAVPEAGLALQIEAHAPGVYRIRCAPPDVLAAREEKPTMRQKAHVEMLLARDEAVGEMATSSLMDAAGAWRMEQGEIALEISSAPLRFALYRGDRCLLRSVPEDALKQGGHNGEAVWRLATGLEPEEYLHGLGETAGDPDRRGCVLVSDDPAARAASLLWSTEGWGLYVNTLGRVEYDLACTVPDACRYAVHDKVLDVFLFAGEPSEIINQFTALTGRAGQPGLWPMGVWLEQAPGMSLDETLAIVETFRANDWSVDTLQMAAPMPYGFQSDKPVFEWNAARCGDAREFHARLQKANVQLAAPTLPAVLQGTQLFEEWEDRGWLLIRDEDGSACVFAGNESSGGQPYGLLDLTNKDVYKLWVERQRQAVDEGLGAPVCSVQADIPDDVTARGGECGAVLRTAYPLLARRALFDAVAGHRTPQEGVVVSTDLHPAVQRSAWQEGPRCENTWAGMEHSLRAALSVGDSGIPVQTHRLGSAQRPLDAMTPELYLRWLAACVFSANFSFQGTPGLLPSAFDASTQALVRHWLQWRYRLIPYVLGIIEDAVRTGLPVQRSMALSFPADAVAQAWDTQYLFGPALLVAPVLEPGGASRVYLPEGQAWWDLNTGWRYEGGTILEVDSGLDTMPVFGREGHMLCLGPGGLHTADFNSARLLDEVWMFGMPEHSPVVMRNKIRVMQMQGSSYIKGLEGLRILPSEGLEVKRRGAEVRISRAR